MNKISVHAGVHDNGDDPPTSSRYVEASTGHGPDRVTVQIEEYSGETDIVFLTMTTPDAGCTSSDWADFCAPVRAAHVDRLIAQLIAARDRARAVGILPATLSLIPTR